MGVQAKKEEVVLDIFASPFQRQTAAAAPAAITPTTAAAATFLGLVRTQPNSAFEESTLAKDLKSGWLCCAQGPAAAPAGGAAPADSAAAPAAGAAAPADLVNFETDWVTFDTPTR